MTDWQPIETAPGGPMDVLLYSQRVEWTDHKTGLPATVPDGARYDVGYWNGEFFYHGSNHPVFEFGDRPGDDDHHPTHWTPLPERPAP